MMKFGFGNKHAEGGKLEEIKKQLAAVQQASDKVGGGETIADDGVIPADKQTQIACDEALVRDVLGLVGVDYDALIKMDGQSVYAKAVEANPDILKNVLGADKPVLAALKVAMGFKPVAEFVGKYGSSPADIKAAMRAEFEAEMAAKEGKGAEGPVFSGAKSGVRAAVPTGVKRGKLVDVFGK